MHLRYINNLNTYHTYYMMVWWVLVNVIIIIMIIIFIINNINYAIYNSNNYINGDSKILIIDKAEQIYVFTR